MAGLEVATTTGTINVQGEFPNPNNLLRPGQFAKVRAVTDRRTVRCSCRSARCATSRA